MKLIWTRTISKIFTNANVKHHLTERRSYAAEGRNVIGINRRIKVQTEHPRHGNDSKHPGYTKHDAMVILKEGR